MAALRKSRIQIHLIVSVSVLFAPNLTVMIDYLSCRHISLLRDVTLTYSLYTSNMTTLLQLLCQKGYQSCII